jgi:hypothetical protein
MMWRFLCVLMVALAVPLSIAAPQCCVGPPSTAVSPPSNGYFANNGSTYSWYTFPTFPHAAYNSSTNTTWITWEGYSSGRKVYVTTYNHGTATWSPVVFVANQPLTNDDHGNPSLLRDAGGYWHIFHGPHDGSALLHELSNNPDDPSAWTSQTSIGTNMEYPMPVLVGSTIYFLIRTQTVNNDWHLDYWHSTSITDGVVTWSAAQQLIDPGADARVYASSSVVRNSTEIHFVTMLANGDDTYRRNVYYVILDTATGNAINYARNHTTAAASLPVSQSDMDSFYKIVSQPTASGTGEALSLAFDNAGNTHVLFSDTCCTRMDGTQALYYTANFGSGWTANLQIGTIASGNTDAAIVAASDGGVDAYWAQRSANGVFADGGDLYTAHRTSGSGGSWNTSHILQSAGTYAINEPAAVLSPNANGRVIWSEIGQTSNDNEPGIGTFKMWLYGDGGYVTR